LAGTLVKVCPAILPGRCCYFSCESQLVPVKSPSAFLRTSFEGRPLCQRDGACPTVRLGNRSELMMRVDWLVFASWCVESWYLMVASWCVESWYLMVASWCVESWYLMVVSWCVESWYLMVASWCVES